MNEKPYRDISSWMSSPISSKRPSRPNSTRSVREGGVLGIMETGYQRGRIQDVSMLYKHRKHDGTPLIVGVNTFIVPNAATPTRPIELARSTEGVKEGQIGRLRDFQQEHAHEREAALNALDITALEGGNLFGELMRTVRHATLGEIIHALFGVGGSYRRNI